MSLTSACRRAAKQIACTTFDPRHVGDQFFFGYVEHQDIFNRPHTSRVCTRIFPAHEDGKAGKMQFAGNESWRHCD